MKRKLLISLIITLLSMPILTLAQTGSSYYDDNTTVFVNTEAFGVHKEYDSKRGCYVWKDSMGGFICLDKNMKPIECGTRNVVAMCGKTFILVTS